MLIRTVAAIALLLSAVLPASAKDQFTVEELILLGNNLAKLDGYEKVVKDGAQERTTKVFYNFEPGLRWQNATSIDKIVAVDKQYRQQLRIIRDAVNAKDVSGNTPEEKAAARAALYAAEDQKLLTTIPGVDIAHIKLDELKLKENPIPATVLGLLKPIIDE